MSIDDRTAKALGSEVMQKLSSLQFCIVGCGGTGAGFAEMLVRTGATRLTLIDGTCIEGSNLNRVFSFFQRECGQPKVEVLKRRLKSIRSDSLKISTFQDHFRAPEDILEKYCLGQEVRNAVCDADVVFIGTDTIESRLAIEELCYEEHKTMYLSCGVRVDPGNGLFEFECVWLPNTPRDKQHEAGYGPENASFASIVHESVSVAFTMLLSHLKCADSRFKLYRKEYDGMFQPVRTTTCPDHSALRIPDPTGRVNAEVPTNSPLAGDSA